MAGRTAPGARRFLVVLLAVYCAKQILIAVLFPPFSGHDEVAHYGYIQVLDEQRRLPTLTRDTLPGQLYEYRDFALHWRDLGQWSTPLYTAVHPPLYYAAMLPVYRAASPLPEAGRQYVLRLAAIPFGLVTVLVAVALAHTIFPGDRFLAITAPAIVAFQPQMSYGASMVNNDALAAAMFSGILYLLVLVLRNGLGPGLATAIGVTCGLGLLSKTALAAAVPLIAAVFLTDRRLTVRRRLIMLTISGGLAAACAAPWYWFMYRTYGDFSGLGTLARLQPDITWDMSFLQLLFSGEFLVARWRETWGEFGWKLIPIHAGLVSALALVAIAAATGLAAYAVVQARCARGDASCLEPWQRRALILLASACALLYLAVVQFGTVFMLTQARYYFPAGAAAALLCALGLRSCLPDRWHAVGQTAVVFGCVAMTVFIYTAHVVPYWYFR